MKPVILTAGLATRAEGYAPAGCKALVPLGGRPVIEWQLDCFNEDPIIVAREEHRSMLESYGEVVTNNRGRGAADALLSAMPFVDGPLIVAYADTFFTKVPEGTDWVGVSDAKGGRRWDVINHGFVDYLYVGEGCTAQVCVGLYAFSDPERLHHIVDRVTTKLIFSQPEVGLAPVLNVYAPWRLETIASWQDVGSVPGIESWVWQD